MSWIEKAKKSVVRDFTGAVPFLEESDIPLGGGPSAANVIYRPGRMGTRPGFADCLSRDGEQRELFSWSQGLSGGPIDWLAYLKDGTSIRITNLSNIAFPTYTLASSFSASRVSFAPWGQRLYFALQSSTMRGVTHGKVWGGDVSSPTASNTFQRPFIYSTEATLALTEPSAGVVSQGFHAVYILFQTRDGFWTRPTPASAVTLSPLPEGYTASGSKNLVATLTPVSAWPSWINRVQVAMSPNSASAATAEMYLVPESITDVSAYRGTSTPIAITVDIDDATLTSTNERAEEYERVLVQGPSNTSPFDPFGVITWNRRLVWFANYGGVDSLLISDQENPEHLTADLHVLQLPGGVTISSWFVLRGVLYVLSAAGKTYAFSDNGDKPVNFSPPIEVDANIGAVSSGAVSATGGASGYALVASQQGLYRFEGTNYPQIPLSFEQTSRWDEIDWTAINEMKLLDFTRERLILFRCKMLSGVYRMLTWSYTAGMSPRKVKFSEWLTWTNKGMPALVPKSPYSNAQELWLGAGAVGSLDKPQRLQVASIDASATFHQDGDSANGGWVQAPWWYQLGPLPPGSIGDVLNHLGCTLRMNGSGKIYLRIFPMSVGVLDSPPTSLTDIEISFVSGQLFYDISFPEPLSSPSEAVDEGVYWLIGNGELTPANYGWADISTFIHYYELNRYSK